MAARAAYTLSHERISVDDLASQPDFLPVGRARMRQWADEEDWDGRRREACAAWRQRAEGSLGASFLRRQARQIQLLGHLHDEAVRLRCQQSVQPRSWESVANVQLKAADLMRQWAKDHAQALAQLGAPAASDAVAGERHEGAGMGFGDINDLTDAEALVGAHAILKGKLNKRMNEKDDVAIEPKDVAEPVQLRRAAGGN